MKTLFLLPLALAGLSGCVAVPYGHGGPSYGYGGPPAVYTEPAYNIYSAPPPVYYQHRDRSPAYRSRDRDRDGIPDRADRDRDGDGTPNRLDRRPNDPRWR
ncbi:MAG TPA: hypothetical protein VLJ57_09470 [Burkholderiaceae bacterium]|nr:hypothetical protein [Burkholderiaceae bacterium]